MKLLHTLASVAPVAIALLASHQSVDQIPTQLLDARSVRVETKLKDVSYCRMDDEIDSIEVSLEGSLTNITDATVLHVGQPLVGSVEVLPPSDARHDGKPLYAIDLEVIGTGSLNREGFWARMRSLPPTATYRFDLSVAFPVARKRYVGTAGVQPGDYRLRLILVPLSLTPRERAAAVAKFRDRGALWSEPTATVPMEFTIPKARNVSSCR
jgi:hypothetical protein